ncbi:hypothetical protein PSTG_13177 [Puccinia striiformis f. sp. tritici PST-78]|uniref:Uncharacterized protein n=1 Tax=Puccinia striiformis f. sp. tritici PST-78 TaxID=1165861 RepID=A0A0L0V3C9_9BASI|nr:hypothetical protein PSTG_13177 [Puccinia striiformis f. sp. tritici PST-78]
MRVLIDFLKREVFSVDKRQRLELIKRFFINANLESTYEGLDRLRTDVPLLLLATLQQQNAVLLADEGAHLKYLGVLADSCQQVLFQYIEFLRTQLTSRSMSDYEKALPSMDLMWDQYRYNPAIVFQVWRPVLSATVNPALKIGTDGEVVINENLVSATFPTPVDQSLEPAHYPNSLLPTVTMAEKILPEQTRKLVG